MKDFWDRTISKLKYADTFHIEFISVLGSLFYFPELMDSCSVQEDTTKYFFYIMGIFGLIGLWKDSIQWRYLHVRCMLITFTMPLFTIALHNLYHPTHLKIFLFQFALSVYLVWRIGSEKMYRRLLARRSKNG